MNYKKSVFAIFILIILMSSCVSKKKFTELQSMFDNKITSLDACENELKNQRLMLEECKNSKDRLETELVGSKSTLSAKENQISDLKEQIQDYRQQRDKQLDAVGDLTVLSQKANENINSTLSQLEERDRYIKLLQSAKTKADSINLALAVNLKQELKDGIDDQDIDIKVDKTVVFINLSDKMLYQSGSSVLNPRAKEVLGKIAQIIQARPEFEVMVEGYTDNRPISSSCIKDNWDLSVKRATSVVRSLQENYNIDPNRLIAAGRGEFNVLASNETAEGRSQNRRTRIIILPKLNQFYDLLDPTKVPE